jgi:hypothetical protein
MNADDTSAEWLEERFKTFAQTYPKDILEYRDSVCNGELSYFPDCSQYMERVTGI